MKKLFVAVFAIILLNPAMAYAQTPAATSATSLPQYNDGADTSIRDYLCTPSNPPDGHDLERCVNRVYRFGIAFGAIALVFFLVYAGYTYMVSGEAGKGKAKSILQNALIGMGLLLGSYLILYFINPSLTTVKVIQPPIFVAQLPTCADVGLGQDCVLTDGTVASGNGSGGGTAYADCPGGKLVPVTGVRTDGSVGPVCQAMLDKLIALKKTTSDIPWLVSSTVDGKHISQCHKTGSSVTGVCADLAMDGGRLPSYSKEAGSTNPKWADLCRAVSALGGVAIANEASKGCPNYKAYDTTTGPNLHIFLSK